MKKSVILCFCNVVLSLVLTLACIQAVPVQASPLQSKTITGVITSGTDGFPLIGVSVQVQENSTGSITDLDGRYSVQASEGQTLVFSYIGFKSQTIKIGTSSIINVVLIEGNEMLDEVVVVGYGVQKKKLVTGATVQVKGDKIAELNTTNPLQAMQGQTPGVNITSISGQPGESLKVSIRGLGTIGNAEPLYLIDGVRGDISNLNPADIESIDILKDAASAAIYGAQAANGVVLVTTKNGKEGKAVVSFDGYFGVQNVAKEVNLLNTEQYIMIMDESHRNSTGSGYNWSGYKSIYDANGNLYDVDWLDKMFEDNAQMQSYTLGITGGSTVSQYAISLGYMSQEGIVGGKDVSNFSRYNFRINSEHKLFKNLLKVGEQVSFVYRDKTGVGVGGQYDNSLRGAYEIAPFVPIYSDNNIYDMPYNDTSNSDWNQESGNPYGLMMMRHNQNKNVFFSGNAYAELQPIKNLKIRTVFGANYSTNEYRNFNPIYQFGSTSRNTNTSVTQNMQHVLELTWTNTATYDWKVNDHAFNALIGMESYQYNGTYLSGSNSSLKEGFDDWEHAYISNGTASSTASGLGVSGYPLDENRTVSYFVRFGWNWKETYMLNATVRADGSSKFAKKNRYGLFPSASLAWNFSEEDFMKEYKSILSNGKLRASWGLTGNNRVGEYEAYALLKMAKAASNNLPSGVYPFENNQNSIGMVPISLANKDLKWETTEQWNVGLDLGFFDERIGINVDWYMKTTRDLLLDASLPYSTGYYSAMKNVGKVRNSGLEFTLNTININRNGFRWSTNFNIAFNKNKVLELAENQTSLLTSAYFDQTYNSQPTYIAKKGYSMGMMYGYMYEGTYKYEDFYKSGDTYVLRPGVPYFSSENNTQPGMPKYKDLNGDGIIDTNDRTMIGRGLPIHTGGFTNDFEYKGFDLSIFFQWSYGNDVLNANRLFFENVNNSRNLNQYATYADRWTPENPTSNIPVAKNSSSNKVVSSRVIEDGSFLRLKTLTLGYTLPKKALRKWGISTARVYVAGQNLWTISGYSGYDPEVSIRNSALTPGLDYSAYPRAYAVNFGINLGF